MCQIAIEEYQVSNDSHPFKLAKLKPIMIDELPVMNKILGGCQPEHMLAEVAHSQSNEVESLHQLPPGHILYSAHPDGPQGEAQDRECEQADGKIQID